MGNILLACEESQAVTIELRALGHNAWSCDIQDCSGGHPEWHIKGDVLKEINRGWDMIIAFPPCTYLSTVGNRWFNVDRYGEKAIKRYENQDEAIDFFLEITDCNAKHLAIENPIGVMNTKYQQPTQIIEPWQFGHGYTKATCLWLKGLPKLKPTNIVDGRKSWVNSFISHPERAKMRSKTFNGVASAMAHQWGGLVSSGIKIPRGFIGYMAKSCIK